MKKDLFYRALETISINLTTHDIKKICEVLDITAHELRKSASKFGGDSLYGDELMMERDWLLQIRNEIEKQFRGLMRDEKED